MHKIDLSNKNIYTDLIFEKESIKTKSKIIDKFNNLKIQSNSNCTTIFFEDITDKDNYLKGYFKNELDDFNLLYEDGYLYIYGNGEMNDSDESEAQEIVDSVMTGDNEFAKKVLVAFARMSEEKWKLIREIIEEIESG